MLQLPKKVSLLSSRSAFFKYPWKARKNGWKGENACYLKFGASHKDLIFEMVPMSLETGLMPG